MCDLLLDNDKRLCMVGPNFYQKIPGGCAGLGQAPYVLVAYDNTSGYPLGPTVSCNICFKRCD